MSKHSGSWPLQTEDAGDLTVVRFPGSHMLLDARNVEILGDRFFALIEERGRCRIVLDFGNVEYLFSAMLGKLISFQKRLQAAGGCLILCNLNPAVSRVFEITRLKNFFTIRAGPPSAIDEPTRPPTTES
jgi:anti-sigma B factor antagonist